ALRGAPTLARREYGKAEVSGLRGGPCGTPERAGIAPHRTFQLGRAACAAIPSRARGTAIAVRSFGRAAIEPRSAPDRPGAPTPPPCRTYRAITACGLSARTPR